MGTESGGYQERYLWSRRTASVVIAGVVAVVAAAGATMPLLPTLVLFAAGLLAVGWGLLQRRAALRVDEAGITLGGSPLHYRATTAVVPWADLVAVVLWQQVLPTGALLPCLGLQCRTGAAPPPAPAGHGRLVAGGLVPDLPPGVLAASRPVRGWLLDRRALAREVARFAPGVWVVDHDTGQVITGNGG